NNVLKKYLPVSTTRIYISTSALQRKSAAFYTSRQRVKYICTGYLIDSEAADTGQIK
ncbi:unnamed protein product, partial [Nesidiocoris tenuis]